MSHDANSNVYNYKYTYAVEIVPICKDDLLFLPARLAQARRRAVMMRVRCVVCVCV